MDMDVDPLDAFDEITDDRPITQTDAWHVIRSYFDEKVGFRN